MFFVCIHVLLSNTIVKCFGHQAYCCGEKAMASQTFAAYLHRKLLLSFIKLSTRLLAHTMLNLKCLALFLDISSEHQSN